MDFTKETGIYERIAAEIGQLEIGVLVNNVGMSYKYPEYLAQVDLSSTLCYISPNCLTPPWMDVYSFPRLREYGNPAYKIFY